MPGFYLFDLIIILVIIADIGNELKTYKEWKRERAKAAETKPAETKPAQSQPPSKP